ncbi:hypothetical protein ACGFJ7_26595 [Actinoplanes sp. NPDC048988]|uniref:hypothetical protein n=1 Tax=Actinoplanes sp. NPDC048988 TaxID=3363901 RepID=UPI003724827B
MIVANRSSGGSGAMKIRSLGAAALSIVLLAGCAAANDDEAVTSSASASDAAGNGVAALPPAEIVGKALAAIRQTTSVHVKGRLVDDYRNVSLDITVAGADETGVLKTSKTTVELITVGGQRYLRLDTASWIAMLGATKGELTAQRASGRWIKLSAADRNFEDLYSVADVEELLRYYDGFNKGPVGALDGQPMISLTSPDVGGDTVYIATTGEPYPIKITSPKSGGTDIAFTEYGATVAEIKAPPNAVDLAKVVS